MYIVGVGKTKFGELSETWFDLARSAIEEALNDASIGISDIDAVFISNFLGGETIAQLHTNSAIMPLFMGRKLPSYRIETACASGGSAMNLALASLSNYRNVLVVGFEKMTGLKMSKLTDFIAKAGDRDIDQRSGLTFPATYAIVAQQYMLKYGATAEDLAQVSFKNHSNANLNELAHFFRKKLTLEQIKNSPIVASPLRIMDCCPVSDGAAALVLSGKKFDDRSIKVAGSSVVADTISLAQRGDLTRFPAVEEAAKLAFKQANLTPKDIDVTEVHDCFTIAELIAMEDLGLCSRGEAFLLLRNGDTLISGSVPINPSGGLTAGGHPIGATGISQIFEITKQLRGEAGKRQISDAKVGLTHNVGGAGGTAAIHIMRRD